MAANERVSRLQKMETMLRSMQIDLRLSWGRSYESTKARWIYQQVEVLRRRCSERVAARRKPKRFPPSPGSQVSVLDVRFLLGRDKEAMLRCHAPQA